MALDRAAPLPLATGEKYGLMHYLKRDRWLYLLLLPGVLYFLIFKFGPMWGIIIAFQDYSPFRGFIRSDWVGLQNFRDFFINPDFFRLLGNTLILSAMNIAFFFPMPIALSLLLNELRNQTFKRVIQTVVYVPHFISMVIVFSITYVLLTTSNGPINGILQEFTGRKVNFLGSPGWFRPLIILQIIWKETGWGTIIFLAAISNVDVQLYEAAIVDGAGRLRQLVHITVPAIMGTVIIMLILRMGHVLDNGFEQIYLMTNSLNRGVADVFDTYVYQMGINQGAFSYSTAVGLFKGLVGLLLVKGTDVLAKRLGQSGIL